MNLLKMSGRSCSVSSFFTSISLAQYLLQLSYVCILGTVKSFKAACCAPWAGFVAYTTTFFFLPRFLGAGGGTTASTNFGGGFYISIGMGGSSQFSLSFSNSIYSSSLCRASESQSTIFLLGSLFLSANSFFSGVDSFSGWGGSLIQNQSLSSTFFTRQPLGLPLFLGILGISGLGSSEMPRAAASSANLRLRQMALRVMWWIFFYFGGLLLSSSSSLEDTLQTGQDSSLGRSEFPLVTRGSLLPLAYSDSLVCRIFILLNNDQDICYDGGNNQSYWSVTLVRAQGIRKLLSRARWLRSGVEDRYRLCPGIWSFRGGIPV